MSLPSPKKDDPRLTYLRKHPNAFHPSEGRRAGVRGKPNPSPHWQLMGSGSCSSSYLHWKVGSYCVRPVPILSRVNVGCISPHLLVLTQNKPNKCLLSFFSAQEKRATHLESSGYPYSFVNLKHQAGVWLVVSSPELMLLSLWGIELTSPAGGWGGKPLRTGC